MRFVAQAPSPVPVFNAVRERGCSSSQTDSSS